MVMTLLWLYLSRNFAKICGLESPEPLANLYSRSFFRTTWVTTALDAGFWTAVRYFDPFLKYDTYSMADAHQEQMAPRSSFIGLLILLSVRSRNGG